MPSDAPATPSAPATVTSEPSVPAPPSPPADEPAPPREPDSAPASSALPPGMTTEGVRQRWPDVMATLAQMKRITWALVQNAQVAQLHDGILQIGFPTDGLASTFRTGPHADPLQLAVRQTLGLKVRVEAVVTGDPPPPPTGGRTAAPESARPQPTSWDAPGSGQPDQPASPQVNASAPPADARALAPEPEAAPEVAATPSEVEESTASQAPAADTDAAYPESEPTPSRRPPWEGDPESEDVVSREVERHLSVVRPLPEPDEPDFSDPDLEGSDLVGVPLVEKILGGTVIEEFTDEGQQ